MAEKQPKVKVSLTKSDSDVKKESVSQSVPSGKGPKASSKSVNFLDVPQPQKQNS